MKREKQRVDNKELEKQLGIINELKECLQGKDLHYYIETFGCQMNEKDSEKLAGVLKKIGYTETQNIKQADFILYNTCCIRENAERKIYGRVGNLRRLKEKKPDLIVAVCGCMMQQEHVLERLRGKYRKEVDIIFGTYNIYKLAELIRTRMEVGHQIIDIWKEHKEIVEDLPSERKYKYKAAVNIMYGCNNFCTYCIVPYVRGRERSRESESIIKEIKNLVADGVKEIMLLGQNVNSYGKGLEDGITFAKLLREINEIEGLELIRYMTSHPKDFNDELIYAIRDCDKVCNYVHLPIQAGSNKVLSAMNRKYTKEQYLSLAEKIKREIKDVSITTDIIVGFPGETDEDFEDTLDVVRKVRYDGAFTFIYSKRTGTKAASMEGQVSEEKVTERFNKLLEETEKIQEEDNAKRKDMVYKVLVENISKNDERLLTGRTEQNILVHFEGDASLIGELVEVKIVETKRNYLVGEFKRRIKLWSQRKL
ncbi:MAG: tRNA (N6-isopentenyl adenosine(37)-C2)-methylthiotransferase MiaB [Clostridiales bacterium GWE2_32_10]|nr:MAG: tRNA (N6-isopentenyl adenosine(37)-C2)-methylthiotransferase MiaB [Clostridiales bacterium GWE2_32_10]HBY20178.1 tRNA (N6-isopentenyl adenosine(37)-C2)-methylthiotransferase MiaB [Clostridiales bacterium]